MKRLFNAFITVMLLSGGALFLPACSTDNGQPESYPVLGTYELDGQEYEIISTRYSNDGSYIMFAFTPLPPYAEMTTYVAFGIRTYWLDSEVNVHDVSHNDDYIFVYEDPIRYYSQYRRPVDGTFFVGSNRENNYTVRIDFTLPDGLPFRMDYTGDFQPSAGISGIGPAEI